MLNEQDHVGLEVPKTPEEVDLATRVIQQEQELFQLFEQRSGFTVKTNEPFLKKN